MLIQPEARPRKLFFWRIIHGRGIRCAKDNIVTELNLKSHDVKHDLLLKKNPSSPAPRCRGPQCRGSAEWSAPQESGAGFRGRATTKATPRCRDAILGR